MAIWTKPLITGASPVVADTRAGSQPSAVLRFDGNTLYLSGVLNFDTVVGLDRAVADWLKGQSGNDCIADLAEVQYSNSAGIALLLGWMRLAAAAKRKLTLRAVPTDMLALAAVGGLSGLFGESAE